MKSVVIPVGIKSADAQNLGLISSHKRSGIVFCCCSSSSLGVGWVFLVCLFGEVFVLFGGLVVFLFVVLVVLA